MRILLAIFSLSVLLSCTGGNVTYYASGNAKELHFSELLQNPKASPGGYYKVLRNQMGKVILATEYNSQGHPVAKYGYKYDRSGALINQSQNIFYHRGPSQKVTEWQYVGGALKKRIDSWYTRDRSFEKRVTTYFDANEKPYLEETQRQGLLLESATEFYYDYYGHLDKSRRDFFNSDGTDRDYWITIYDDTEKILREEHYLSNNTLLAFYRYTYHPAFGYLEREEILDENRQLFIVRDFNASGLLVQEIRKNRDLTTLVRISYEYDENDNPIWEYEYDANDNLKEKRKYSNPIVREGFRRPR